MQTDLETKIRERAYALWEQEGRFDGREHDHWYRAEREVAAAFAQPAEAAAAPAKRRAPAAKATAAAAKTRRAAKAQVLHS